MKAIVVHQHGDPSVLRHEEAPDPVAGEAEVLVRAKAIGVNPVDAYVRSGTYAASVPLPYVPGTEGAGVIETGPLAGQRVFFLGSAGPRHTGCYAERVRCRAESIWPLPDHITDAQGAAVAVTYATAWRALFERGAARAGDAVLVHGASGGVGTAAVQLACAAGLTVIGTAGSPRGQQLVRDCGAAHVVDHRADGYERSILDRTGERGVDLVVEMLANANLDRDLDLLAPGGRVVVVGSRGRVEIDPRKTMGRESSVTGVMLWGGGEASLRRAFAAVVAGLFNRTLNPMVGDELPLRDAARAHALVMQDGRYGKIVLIP